MIAICGPEKLNVGHQQGLYCTAYNIKVMFCMSDFPRSRITSHQFHVDNNEEESVIGYEMVIGSDLMVRLVMVEYFKQQVLKWDDSEVTIKETVILIVQTYLTSRKMREVEMKTEEPYSTKESTEMMEKL